MGQIADWIILGLLAGIIARWVLPGQEKGGWFATMTLGIFGAVLAGWFARNYGFFTPTRQEEWLPSLPSILSASVGAIIVLGTWKWLRT